jgi:hypothetical protein
MICPAVYDVSIRASSVSSAIASLCPASETVVTAA